MLRCSTILVTLAMFLPADSGPIDSIVRGDDPAQFDLAGIGPESIRIEGGEIRLTGKPFGLFATKRSYSDFTLTFEWAYDRPADLVDDARFPGNGGVLLQVEPPLQVWPKGVEVQLAQVDPGALFALGEVGFEGKANPEAQKMAVKPVGQWNRAEITSKGGTVVSALNGVEVARGTIDKPKAGPIAWLSEGAPIRFRDLRIKALN